MALSDLGLDVRRLKHRETKRERTDNVQAYLVQHVEGEASEVNGELAYVEWRGAGTSDPRLCCQRCRQERHAEPDCAHIEAVRVHLGYRELP